MISFGGDAAPTAIGTRVPRDVMFFQAPGSVAQPGSSNQPDALVRAAKEKGRKIITAMLVITLLVGKRIKIIILGINTKLEKCFSAM